MRQKYNLRLSISYIIVFLIILCTTSFILSNKVSFGVFFHNLGVRKYYHYYTGKSNPSDLRMALTLMEQAVKFAPNNPISRARLASVYLSANNYESAFQQAKLATTLSGQQDGSCQMGQTYAIRMFSRLNSYQPVELLNFSHPLSVWHFNLHNGASGCVMMESVKDGTLKCIAHITVDIDQSPDRYAILAQDITLKPDTSYKLIAFTKTNGVFRAWLGVRSQWPGVQITQSTEWQAKIIVFRTNDYPNEDFVHLVIDQGHGTLSVRNIQLTPIEEP